MRLCNGLCGVIGGAALALAATAAPAQEDYQNVEIEVHAQRSFSNVEIAVQEVADNVYMLTGQGGNIGLSVGEDGAFLIDDQFAPLTPKIKAAIETVTDKPVAFVVNTHYHGDHTGGNEKWGEAGAIIVAQENVRERLGEPQRNPISGARTPAAPEGALPVVTFPEEMTFHWNGDTVDVRHIEDAHTDGDVFIHFRNADVIHGGDVANMASYPIIDRHAGGTYAGYVAGQAVILDAMGPDTVLIPGHGQVSTRQDLQESHDMLITIRDRIAEAKAAGKSLEDVQAMKPTAAFDARWGGGFVSPDDIVAVIYNELP